LVKAHKISGRFLLNVLWRNLRHFEWGNGHLRVQNRYPLWRRFSTGRISAWNDAGPLKIFTSYNLPTDSAHARPEMRRYSWLESVILFRARSLPIGFGTITKIVYAYEQCDWLGLDADNGITSIADQWVQIAGGRRSLVS
jgi:hypothetical protein